ncbi:SDR family oxidoreductase [Colwellia sp. MEBiC06753]
MVKKIALVTGGNRGLGKAITTQLAQQGMHVIVTARVLADGQQVVDELNHQGLSAECMVLDVNSEQEITKVVAAIQEKHARLDVLVNNAGVALDKWVSAQDLSLDVFKATMNTNVYACLSLIQACLPLMKQQGYGRIVNMSSELGSLTEMQMGMTLAYRTSKTALNAITRILAIELADYPNIKINAAAPGWVKTELGGEDAPLTPEQGAITPVWLATLPEDGPSGGFYREKSPYPW